MPTRNVGVERRHDQAGISQHHGGAVLRIAGLADLVPLVERVELLWRDRGIDADLGRHGARIASIT